MMEGKEGQWGRRIGRECNEEERGKEEIMGESKMGYKRGQKISCYK